MENGNAYRCVNLLMFIAVIYMSEMENVPAKNVISHLDPPSGTELSLVLHGA